VECANPFVNKVAAFDPLVIDWTFSMDGGASWYPAGRTQNQTYITLGDPRADLYHTVVHVSSTAAHDQDQPDEIVAKIWEEFSDRHVFRAGDHQELTYYHAVPTVTFPPASVVGLLTHGDGRCGAWGRFLRDTIKVQGITDSRNQQVIPVPRATFDSSILVKDWDMTPAMRTPQEPPEARGSVPGQGNPHPAAQRFTDHAVVTYKNKIYDPSYGGQPFGSLVEWQRASLDGVFYYNSSGIKVEANSGSAWTLHVKEGVAEP
jgi:hypothetical protein